ncbi:MAG TPA: dephospho-CoA kinase [Longimicrobiales bacterium]|nr:dephospho-CoA kinase [Longimicrobiales bacterium]
MSGATAGRPFRVGLTGNIAAGKSTVAAVWAERGAVIVDADRLARQAVAPGSAALDRVAEVFGAEVLTPEGELDRAALGRRVFADPAARARLEAIVHPEVARLRPLAEQEALAGASPERAIVVHDIPLLYEAGLEDDVDMVVLVHAPADVRRRRLVEDRGMDAAEADHRIAAQMPSEAKLGRADLVIANDAGLAELRRAADGAWNAILAAAAGGGVEESSRVRVDMHLHTGCSFDCSSDPVAVLETALTRGIDRICVTDHNRISTALALRDRYPDRVIVGEEVKTGEGVDVIGLFLEEEIPKGTPALETCERIHAQGGIVYVPHPFATGKGGGGSILPAIEARVDAVEGFNARLHLQRLNDRAVAWAAERDLPLGAGSDAHTLGEVGRAFASLPPFDMEPASFLEALRDATIHGRFSSWAVHLASTWAKLRKRLPGAPRGLVTAAEGRG